MRQQPDLSDVTICAADSAFVGLTARALELSMAQCRFGDAILFSDVPFEGSFRNVPIARLPSVAAYSHFCLRVMPDLIRTPYALVVQWDGYVVDGSAWANAFRKSDYIGAAWHNVFPPGVPLVGNGGFSLRSAKLLRAIKKLPGVGDYQEDRVICHVFRQDLERRLGIRFAPPNIADRFSYEFVVPKASTFGFHGITNMWRHATDDDFAEVTARMDVTRMDPIKTLNLVRNCHGNAMERSAATLYRTCRNLFPPTEIERVLRLTLPPHEAAAEVRKLETLLPSPVAKRA